MSIKQQAPGALGSKKNSIFAEFMSTSETQAPGGPIEISIDSVLRAQFGRRVPGFVVRFLERFVCQEQLNELLRKLYPRRGADFCAGVLRELDIEVEMLHAHRLPASPRAIFVCNHPLGGLDGMALIAALSRHYEKSGCSPVRFVVNDLLMAVEPLRDVFLPLNTRGGRQKRGDVGELDRVLASDGPVGIFPAGLVSRKQSGGVIRDLVWRKMFVTKALESGRPVVPLYFSGRNTAFFYNFARFRKALGLKFNIEMARLPAEVFRARGSSFSFVCGEPLSPAQLAAMGTPAQAAAQIRERVYSLK